MSTSPERTPEEREPRFIVEITPASKWWRDTITIPAWVYGWFLLWALLDSVEAVVEWVG